MIIKFLRSIHGAVMDLSWHISSLLNAFNWIDIKSQRYWPIRPADVLLPIMVYVVAIYVYMFICIIALILQGVSAFAVTLLAAPIPLFLFSASICKVLLEWGLRKTLQTLGSEEREEYERLNKK